MNLYPVSTLFATHRKLRLIWLHIVADLVALGTVMSVNLCGGKYIPYRPGRIDAFQADSTTGVPEPGTDLEETLALFERAGFGQEDSISLTACGHTMVP